MLLQKGVSTGNAVWIKVWPLSWLHAVSEWYLNTELNHCGRHHVHPDDHIVFGPLFPCMSGFVDLAEICDYLLRTTKGHKMEENYCTQFADCPYGNLYIYLCGLSSSWNSTRHLHFRPLIL